MRSRKTRKNIMLLICMLVCASLLLVACGGSEAAEQAEAVEPVEEAEAVEEAPAEDAGEAAAEKPFEGQSITILLETVPDTEYVQELLPEFEEATGMEVNVEVLTYVAMYEKLVPQLSTGVNNGAYDVIVVDKQWVGSFVGADWLLPLDDYIAADNVDTSVYIPSMFEMLGEVDGTTYMLPFYNYAMGLYYRTDIFNDEDLKAEYKEEFGTDLRVPESVDEYVQVAKFLTRDTDDDGEIDMYGASQQLARGVGIHAEWANIFFSLGGWYYDDEWNAAVNGEAGVKALESMIALYKDSGPEGATAYNFDEQVALFNQGKAATMFSYSTMYAPLNNPDSSSVAGNIDLAVAPGGHGVNGGWGWAIPRSAPNYDAAWAFMKWVESAEIAKARAMLGGSPTQAWLFEEADLIEKFPFYATEQEIIAEGKPVPIIGGAAQMVDILARELSLAVAEGKDPQQAMDDAAAEMNEIVKNDPMIQ